VDRHPLRGGEDGVKLTHFYHVYAVAAWRDAVTEHLDVLVESGLPIGAVKLGIVGTPDDQAQVYDLVSNRIPATVVARAEQGAEEITLDAVWRWARRSRLREGAALYAHTKGVHNATPLNIAWRRSMTRHLVAGWRECVPQLADHDLIGCHWLALESIAGRAACPSAPCFGGNFWWATRGWLAGLDAPKHSQDRFDAETWIGGGIAPETPPRVVDLNPGWPAMELFQ
jgi:hypothetical protein